MFSSFKQARGGVFAQAEARDAQRSATTARTVVLTISGLLVAGIWLATATTVPELVRAHGELLPSGHYQQIQSAETGVVADVVVEEGDVVKAGQVLTILTSPEIEQAQEDAQHEMQSAKARLANLRLIAERAAATTDFSPSELLAMVPDEMAYARSQLTLFAAQQEVHQKLRAFLENTVDTLENARSLTVKRIETRRDRVKRAEQLFADNLTTRRDLDSHRDSLDQLQASLIEIDIRLSQAAKDLGSASTPLEQNLYALLEKTTKEIFELEDRIKSLEIEVAALTKRQQRLEIRAPADGIVHAVGFPNTGEVIAAGTTLFELMPSGPRLIAELKINPIDIGHIKRGDPVALKFDTFDPRRFGQVQGRVASVSPNSVTDEQTGDDHFRATVLLDQNTIGQGA